MIIVAVAPPIVPKKQEFELLRVSVRERVFRDREKWHLQVHVGRDACIDLLVGFLRQRVDSVSGFVGQKATEQDHTFTKGSRQ